MKRACKSLCAKVDNYKHMKYFFILSVLILVGCNSDAEFFESIVVSDNVEIYSETNYFVHNIENTKVVFAVKNISNYEIQNNHSALTIQKLNAMGEWEITDNVSYNEISEIIPPYKTAIDTFSISAEGIYRIGYELFFSKNPNESDVIFSPQIKVVQQRTILPFRNISPSKYFSTKFSAERSSLYVINSLEDLDSVSTNILHNGDLFYSLLKNQNFNDSTLIGYTTALVYGSGAHLVTDSLINIKDTIWVNYTFDTHSVYQDVVGHTSVVAIKKTELPILLGEFK